MSTHFESFGNFTTGVSSYWGLISKKSRGTIQLTDKSFSFRSAKDKILFDIKISNIQNFYLIKRFRFLSIELITDQGVYYNLYPRTQQNKMFGGSEKLAKELFTSLVRVVYKGDYPILFETKGSFIKKKVKEGILQEKRHNGIVILTEEYILFKAYKKKPNKKIPILEIEDTILHNNNSEMYLQIKLKDKNVFSIIALKNKRNRNRKDKVKTAQLYEMLIQAKQYKISENIKKQEEDEMRIKRLKSMFEVSNKVRLDMVRLALDMEEKTFTNKIFQWAKKFKFIIDGDYLIVNTDTINKFIEDLKLGFDLTIRGELKTNCINCGKSFDYTAKICPYCGKEQVEI